MIKLICLSTTLQAENQGVKEQVNLLTLLCCQEINEMFDFTHWRATKVQLAIFMQGKKIHIPSHATQVQKLYVRVARSGS